MPVPVSYPGVYIEELKSGVHTIVGVPTSITAFVGRTLRGPVNEPITINGFGDFERRFGGLWAESTLGYAVRDFFINGGGQAIIVRLFGGGLEGNDLTNAQTGAKLIENIVTGAASDSAAVTDMDKAINDLEKPPVPPATATPPATITAAKAVQKAVIDTNKAGGNLAAMKDAARLAAAQAASVGTQKIAISDLHFIATSSGKAGANLRVEVSAEPPVIPGQPVKTFSLTVRDDQTSERFDGLSLDEKQLRRLDKVLENESQLLRWDDGAGKFETNGYKLGDLVTKITAIPALRKAFDDEKDPTKLTPPRDNLLKALNELWALSLDPLTTLERTAAFRKKYLSRLRELGMKTSEQAYKDAEQDSKDADNALKIGLITTAAGLSDGSPLTVNDFFPVGGFAAKQGLPALEKADLFNLLCIPPHTSVTDIEGDLISQAIAYCKSRRAMLLIDPPSTWNNKETALKGLNDIGDASENAAIFFPRLRQPDPLNDGRFGNFAPCGAVAGVFARTDNERGVWKAPAGIDATLNGVPQLSVSLTDAENGELNPKGLNCLRTFPAAGRVVWGARTRRGDDSLTDQWKYIPVRRTALFIEESLFRATKWVVFEPNDEPLWAQIRLNVGAFMQDLFRKGAFQGKTPREAYLVKCDRETTTQQDIDKGIVNILVGFAPLKPAEFVIIQIEQLAGQLDVV